MFFFLNENILQRVIAHSVAQQSSFTWMHLYLPHFTYSDLGGLWLPSRKKNEASHPGNALRCHVTFCGSHVVIFCFGLRKCRVADFERLLSREHR